MSTSAAQVDASKPVLAKIAWASNRGFTGAVEVTAKVAGQRRQVTVWLYSGKVYAIQSPQYAPPAQAWAERAIGGPIPDGDGEVEFRAYSLASGNPRFADDVDAARRDWAYGILTASLTWQRPSIKLRKRQTIDTGKFEASTWQRIITDLAARTAAYESGWAAICHALATQGKPVGGAHVVAPRMSVVIPGNRSFHDPVSLDELAAKQGRTRAALVGEIGRSIQSGFPIELNKVAPFEGAILVPEALEDPEHAFAPAVTMVGTPTAGRDAASLIPVEMEYQQPAAMGASAHDEPVNGLVDFPVEFMVTDEPRSPLLAQLAQGGGLDADLISRAFQPVTSAELVPASIDLPDPSLAAGAATPVEQGAAPAAFSFDDFPELPTDYDALAAPLTGPVAAPAPQLFEERHAVADAPYAPLNWAQLLDAPQPSFEDEPADDLPYAPPAVDTYAPEAPAPYAPVTPAPEPFVLAPPYEPAPVEPAPAPVVPTPFSPPMRSVQDPSTWLGAAAASFDDDVTRAIMKRVQAATIEEHAALVTRRDQSANLARAARAELGRADAEYLHVKAAFENVQRINAQKQAEHEDALHAHDIKRAQIEAVRTTHNEAAAAASSEESRLEELLAQIAQAQIRLEGARVAEAEAAAQTAASDAEFAATTQPAVQRARAEVDRFVRESLTPAQRAVELAEDTVARLRAQQDAAVNEHAELVEKVEKAQRLLAAFANQ